MVLEVLTHGREVHNRGHTDLLQEAAGANSGHLEDLGRVERASGQDGLVANAHSRPGRIGGCRKLIALLVAIPAFQSGTGPTHLNSSNLGGTVGSIDD